MYNTFFQGGKEAPPGYGLVGRQ